MSFDPAEWPWVELELKNDVFPSDKDIRRAYSKKLKAIDTERDPNAFQQLRYAYETGRYMVASQMQAATVQPTSVPRQEPDLDSEYDSRHHNQYESSSPLKEGIDTHDASQGANQQPATNCSHIFETDGAELQGVNLNSVQRTMQSLVDAAEFDASKWRALFKDVNSLGLSEGQTFEHSLLQSFDASEVFKDIDKETQLEEVCEFLEDYYGWLRDGLRFQKKHPEFIALRSTFSQLNIFKHKPSQNISHDVVVKSGLPFYFTWWFFLLALFVALASLMIVVGPTGDEVLLLVAGLILLPSVFSTSYILGLVLYRFFCFCICLLSRKTTFFELHSMRWSLKLVQRFNRHLNREFFGYSLRQWIPTCWFVLLSLPFTVLVVYRVLRVVIGTS